jgi:hypothetical protein
MTRIVSWLTATLIAVALITYYQANLSGEGERAHAPATAACGAPQAQATAASNQDEAGDACANSDHSGKPGESK